MLTISPAACHANDLRIQEQRRAASLRHALTQDEQPPARRHAISARIAVVLPRFAHRLAPQHAA